MPVRFRVYSLRFRVYQILLYPNLPIETKLPPKNESTFLVSIGGRGAAPPLRFGGWDCSPSFEPSLGFWGQAPSKVLSLHGDPHDDMAQAVLPPADSDRLQNSKIHSTAG